jgi:hypothetical protein
MGRSFSGYADLWEGFLASLAGSSVRRRIPSPKKEIQDPDVKKSTQDPDRSPTDIFSDVAGLELASLN